MHNLYDNHHLESGQKKKKNYFVAASQRDINYLVSSFLDRCSYNTRPDTMRILSSNDYQVFFSKTDKAGVK